MIFKKLVANNFLSFEHLEYDFQMHPIQIQGENLTDDDQESNGSGKSAIQAMIEYALLSTNSRKVKDSELIRFGCNSTDVQLFVFCSVRNETLAIHRTLTKRGSQLQLYVNDEPVNFSNVRDGNSFIIEWIGINKDDLYNYFIINKERFLSFFTSSNRQKMELINRFSNVSMLDGVDDNIRNEIKKHTDEVNKLLRDHSYAKGELNIIETNIEAINNQDFENIREKHINDMRNQIEENLGLIIYLQESLNNSTTYYEELKEEIKGIKAECEKHRLELRNFKTKNFEKQYSKVNEQLTERIDALRNQVKVMGEIRAVEDELNTIINDINLQLMGTINCPECSHEFIPGDPNFNIEAEKEHLALCHTEMEKVVIQLRENQLIIDSIQEDMETLRGENYALRKQEAEANKARSIIKAKYDEIDFKLIGKNKELNRVEQEIRNFEDSISRHIYDNDRLESEINVLSCGTLGQEDELKGLQIQKVEKENKIAELDAEIKGLGAKVIEAKEWGGHFQRFKLHLANKPLKAIESHCNHYLEKMHSDIRIMLKGFKIKANGDLKEEITPYVVREEIRDFGSFSGGERGRVLFSMILAIQHMINTTNKWGGLNFLSIDEIFEGIDAKGLRNLMKSVQTITGTILVITHVVDRSVSVNKLTVEKINGLSKIKQL